MAVVVVLVSVVDVVVEVEVEGTEVVMVFDTGAVLVVVGLTVRPPAAVVGVVVVGATVEVVAVLEGTELVDVVAASVGGFCGTAAKTMTPESATATITVNVHELHAGMRRLTSNHLHRPTRSNFSLTVSLHRAKFSRHGVKWAQRQRRGQYRGLVPSESAHQSTEN